MDMLCTSLLNCPPVWKDLVRVAKYLIVLRTVPSHQQMTAFKMSVALTNLTSGGFDESRMDFPL